MMLTLCRAGEPAPAVFNPSQRPVRSALFAYEVFGPAEYAEALALARAGKPHRQFKFGRKNNHWVINGETWDTFKIAAAVSCPSN